jgi:hypothetical protein
MRGKHEIGGCASRDIGVAWGELWRNESGVDAEELRQARENAPQGNFARKFLNIDCLELESE